MNDFRPSLDWRAQIREHRQRLGVTQPELARRTGLSLTAVKAYENGKRRPSTDALDAILVALGLAPEQANPIRAGAGYAINFSALFDNRYIFDREFAQQQADRLPWPVYITNQATLVVVYNRAFEALLDVDVEREFPDPAERNLLAYASEPRFTRGLENFDEVVGMLIGLAKGDPRVEADVERPPPWSAEAVQKFLQKDPAFIRPFLELWEKQPPIPHRTRHVYEVHWRFRGEPPALRFIASLSPADLWDELWWNEWTPADARTHDRLAEIVRQGG
jgi:transcriptional regulator with XRE-family HTH domain